jgi:hypothetical protein
LHHLKPTFFSDDFGKEIDKKRKKCGDEQKIILAAHPQITAGKEEVKSLQL